MSDLTVQSNMDTLFESIKGKALALLATRPADFVASWLSAFAPEAEAAYVADAPLRNPLPKTEAIEVVPDSVHLGWPEDRGASSTESVFFALAVALLIAGFFLGTTNMVKAPASGRTPTPSPVSTEATPTPRDAHTATPDEVRYCKTELKDSGVTTWEQARANHWCALLTDAQLRAVLRDMGAKS